MIRIYHKKVDITDMVIGFTWSGSLSTVSRKVEFDIVVSPTDYYLPTVTIMNGDIIDLVDSDGKVLYKGHVFSKSKSTNDNAMKVVTYDYTIYLSKNKDTFNFKGLTPKQITTKIADKLNMQLGKIEDPDIKITRVFENTSYYEIIQTAYTLASKKTGKLYQVNYRGNKLNVVEVGKTKSEYTISEDADITNSSYSESIENVVNRVVLYDDKGKRIGVVENKGDREKYGTIQAVYKGKDANQVGKSHLKTLERTAKIEALGDTKCITGNSVNIRESYTGLSGEFFIISDTHNFRNNMHTMSLDLSFNKMMDEKEAGSKPEKKE